MTTGKRVLLGIRMSFLIVETCRFFVPLGVNILALLIRGLFVRRLKKNLLHASW